MNPSYGIFGAPVNFAHAAATHQAYHPASPTTQAYYSSPTVGPTQGSPQRKTNDPYAASVTPPLAVEAAAGAGGMGGSTGTPSNLSFDASHLLSSMTPPASPLLTGGSQTAAQVAHQQQQQQAYASGDASGLQWGALAGNGASHSTAVPLQNISHDALLAAAIQVQHQQQQLAMLSAAAGFGPHPNPLQQQLLANALLMQSGGGGHMQAAPQDPNHLMMLMLMHQQQQAAAVAQLQQHHQLQQQQQSHHFQHHSQQQQQHVAVGSRASHGAGGNAYDDLDGQRGGGANNAAPTLEALRGMSGSLCDVARTANGSSMIQNAIKERGTGPEGGQALQFILQELYPQLGDLLLDSHGCYVVKTLIDHLPAPQLQQLLSDIAADEPLAFSLCTHSLHTRRVVQHVMEQYDGHFLIDLLTRRCAEVAMTQQGCIVMQRAMDRAVGPQRDALYAAIHKNFLHFCRDAFANYVVQHLLEVGNRESNSTVVSAALQGRVVELSCNKFASNVVEKCLFHVTAEVQHQILVEMYTSGEQTLNHMLQDSFGNYIIQSSIALATFRDVWFINEHLRPVLRLTPYGHKIEARLDRRMKGKTVQARQHLGAAEGGTEVVERPSAAATSGPAGPFQGGRGASRGGRGGAPGGRAGGGRGGRGAHSAAADPVNAPMVPSNEEPW